LAAEISRILALGVRLEAGQTVNDITGAMAEGRFDAAFLAMGSQAGRRAYIPAGDSARILDAVRYLHDGAEGGSAPLPGAEISTLRAPDFRCRAASSRARNLPVDSITRLTPSPAQSMAAGSRSDSTGISRPA